jgi:hypothetical protein
LPKWSIRRHDDHVDVDDESAGDETVMGHGRVGRQKNFGAPPYRELQSPEWDAITLHNELPITPTWRTNCQGSGCRLTNGGSGPKCVGGYERDAHRNLGETRETQRFILVWASGE